MKTRSLSLALLLAGGAALSYACSSGGDGKKTQPESDAASGGASGSGGSSAESGGSGTTGGKGGGTGGAGTSDASMEGGADSGSDGANGTGGASNTGGANSTGGANNTGGVGTGGTASSGGTGGVVDAGDPCANFRCQPSYPAVQYPSGNLPSDDKAMLGKILFWDEQIGELNSMACGTCHRAASGGSDPRTTQIAAHLPGPDGISDPLPIPQTSDDIRGAQGVPSCQEDPDGGAHSLGGAVQVTTRKPPSYLDAMFADQIFWDGRAGYCKANEAGTARGGCFYDPDVNGGAPPTTFFGTYDPSTSRVVGYALEAQASGPPVSPVEMACPNQDWTKIAAKLRNVIPLNLAHAKPPEMSAFIAAHNSSYPQMFAAVYGTAAKVNAGDPNDVINTRRIVFAIATHERRLTSNQTPWDRWIAGDDTAMTDGQIRGYVTFMGKARCFSCHAPPLFTDNAFHFLGFHKPTDDIGREKITAAPQDANLGQFKTPTLRNVGLREPFGLLHNGAGPGENLANVMALYNTGGRRTDPDIGPYIDPLMLALNLSQQEIDDIIDFLRNGLTDPRVQNEDVEPFTRPRLSTEP